MALVPDALALAEQLDQSHDTEETKEVDGDHVATGLEISGTKILNTEVNEKVS
jgi:hypothetical protein